MRASAGIGFDWKQALAWWMGGFDLGLVLGSGNLFSDFSKRR